MTEVTIDQIHLGIEEELNQLRDEMVAHTTEVKRFQREGSGKISKITAVDLIELDMEDAVTRLVEDPSPSNIEKLFLLQISRVVAARIESGAVLGSRAEAMKEPVVPKPKSSRRMKAKPEAPVEALESNQDFLTELEKVEIVALAAVPVITAPTPESAPVVQLTPADNGVLDLL